jgi:hypothetical protein
MQQESSEVHLDYYDHSRSSSRFGFKYYGYVYLVQDKSGKVILGAASPDTLWQKADKLADTNLDEEFSF